MQEQQVEFGRAATCEFFLGGHLEVIGVLGGTAQAGICETGIAFGALSLAFVNIVPDGTNQAVSLASNAAQSASKHFVSLTVAINISGHESANALFVGALNHGDKAILRQGFAKMHVASAAPGAVSCACQIHQTTGN